MIRLKKAGFQSCTGSALPSSQANFAAFDGLNSPPQISPHTVPQAQQYNSWPGPGAHNGGLDTSSWDGPSNPWQNQPQITPSRAQQPVNQQPHSSFPQTSTSLQPTTTHPSSNQLPLSQTVSFQPWLQNSQPSQVQQQQQRRNYETQAQEQNGTALVPA